MPLVSVIIPAYNASNTIEDCLCSLNKQSDNNFEVIVYDDGSLDDTLIKVESFKRYSNFPLKIFTGDNRGVSYARNFAISKASGDFLAFIDSDDVVESNYIRLFNNANNLELADLYIGEIHSSAVNELTLSGFYKTNALRYVIECLDSSDYLGYLHNKFYRKSVIVNNNISFPENLKMSEDLIFNMRFFNFNESCYIFEGSAYVYSDSEGSLSKMKSSFPDIELREKEILNNYIAIESKLVSSGFFPGKEKRILTLKLQLIFSALSDKKVTKGQIIKIIKVIKNLSFDKKVFSLMNRNEKIKLLICKLPFVLYFLIYLKK